jgi:hypothetical protein
LVLTFQNSFRDRMDTELRTRLAAELPGVALWALEGLRRLRANGMRFTVGERGRKAIARACWIAKPCASLCQRA